MQVTILGSGTSIGIPVLGCKCKVCTSQNPKNFRTRCSILITDDQGRNLAIDTGPEFRMQMLREKVDHLEHVLYTHGHSDHANGFDDLRGYFFSSRKPIHCYIVESDVEDFKNRFAYVFKQTGYMGSKPDIQIETIPVSGRFKILNFEIETARLPHGNTTTSCFKFGSFLYATDFKSFPEELITKWRGKIDTMIASGPRFTNLPTHSTIPETLALFEQLQVKRGFITHLSHEVDHDVDQAKLPPGIQFAYDGMKLNGI